MKYERERGGLVVEHNAGGWSVVHAGSGLKAIAGGLRQRRFAEEARTDLLATGIDFSQESGKLSELRGQWSEVYYRWSTRAGQHKIDPETFEYYPVSCSYGQRIPSAQWAADMRAAVAAGDAARMEELWKR